jgi:hypothetical protein
MADDIALEKKFERLQDALRRDNYYDVQDAMFELGAVTNGWKTIPDAVVERLLALLRSEEMYTSPHAGHILNFFEFESPSLTDRQK